MSHCHPLFPPPPVSYSGEAFPPQVFGFQSAWDFGCEGEKLWNIHIIDPWQPHGYVSTHLILEWNSASPTGYHCSWDSIWAGSQTMETCLWKRGRGVHQLWSPEIRSHLGYHWQKRPFFDSIRLKKPRSLYLPKSLPLCEFILCRGCFGFKINASILLTLVSTMEGMPGLPFLYLLH